MLSGPPPGGLFAEELRGHLAPFSSFLPTPTPVFSSSQEGLTGSLPPSLDGFTVMHKPLKLLALPHSAHKSPDTSVRDSDDRDRDRLARGSGSCEAHCPSLLPRDPIP